MSGEFMRSSQHFNQTHKATSKPPSNHTLSLKNWEEFIFLTSGSLLARGCQSALELANHSKRLQQKAFDFGALMTYCHQLKDDIIALNEPDPHHQSFFAPLILYTHHVSSIRSCLRILHPSFYSFSSGIKSAKKNYFEF